VIEGERRAECCARFMYEARGLNGERAGARELREKYSREAPQIAKLTRKNMTCAGRIDQSIHASATYRVAVTVQET